MDFNDFLTRTVDFMRNNIVVVSTPRDRVIPHSDVYHMALTRSQSQGDKPVWTIGYEDKYYTGSKAPDSYGIFNAYWLPYNDDNMFSILLEDDADLMFTARMDGCSFGAGSETPSHARLVSHVNVSRKSSTDEGFATQQRQQRALLEDAGADSQILGADSYSRWIRDRAEPPSACGIRAPVSGSFIAWSTNPDHTSGST